MKDKVIIKDLMVRGILGINPEERINKQDIVVNVVMETDIKEASKSDNIEHALNYRSVAKEIIDIVHKTEYFLIERLIDDIARMIFKDFTPDAVTIRIEKPGALRFAESVGLEIFRTRDDY
jgi:FolB domain-containing protein